MATSDPSPAGAAFDAFLARAWRDHADHADAVAERLRRETPEPATAAQVAALARFVVHLLGEHLGRFDDALWRLSALAGHRLAAEPVAQSELAVATAAVRLVRDQADPPAALTGGERARAFGSAATVSLGRGWPDRAMDCIARARRELAGMSASTPADHRALAVACNNMLWELVERGDRRSDAETAAMLEVGAACREHWGVAGTWLEAERSEYGLAIACLSARRADDALRHAAQCLATCLAHDAPPYELFFGHEALARVQHVRGDRAAFAHHLAQARAAFDALDGDAQAACRSALDGLLAPASPA